MGRVLKINGQRQEAGTGNHTEALCVTMAANNLSVRDILRLVLDQLDTGEGRGEAAGWRGMQSMGPPVTLVNDLDSLNKQIGE